MKKQNKTIIAVLVVLAAALAVLAAVHILTREKVPEGAIAIHSGEKVFYADPSKLDLVPVQGIVINGKGQEIAVDEKGYELSAVLAAAKVDLKSINAVTVSASDEFSASLTGEEVNERGKAYLVSEDGGLKLVVFGDTNMKRNVKNVEKITVE